MKIWDTGKLDSVLKRCYVPSYAYGTSTLHTRSLTSLLESEKRFGTTTERDPSQRRHDYHYFSKGSYFVLVEDIRQELATIAAHEYLVSKTPDGQERGAWPVPYCHPLSRGPFIEYNIKEERRREKMERAEKEREEERAAAAKKLKVRQMQQRKQNDLRRCVSLSNLHRNFNDNAYENYTNTNFIDNNGASGFDSNAYIAASGNSMSIASTAFGTTSTMGAGSSTISGLGLESRGLSRVPLPEVLTSRRVGDKEPSRSTSFSKASASSAMMPPPEVPDRQTLLRKCKSTNTLKMPKRDEKSKPGYCESCRQKFEDFKVVRGSNTSECFDPLIFC